MQKPDKIQDLSEEFEYEKKEDFLQEFSDENEIYEE
jgi:hypothetical protein